MSKFDDLVGQESDLAFELEGGLVFKGRGVITRKAPEPPPEPTLPSGWKWSYNSLTKQWLAALDSWFELYKDGSWLIRLDENDAPGGTLEGPSVEEMAEVVEAVRERNGL